MTTEINEIVDSVKVVDIPELLHKKLWEYKAEGRANLVVAYRGDDVKYNGVVLRVRKITLEEYKKTQQIKQRIIINEYYESRDNNDNDTEDDDVTVEILDNEKTKSYNAIDKLQIYNLLYGNFIINNFLGERFSGMNILLKLNPTFLENLNRYIYPTRPENRRTVDRIDNEQFYGTLSLDYSKVRRTQTFIPASITATPLDLSLFNSLDNEPLSNIITSQEQNNKDTQNSQSEGNYSNDEQSQQEYDIETITLSSKPLINRNSSIISVHVANIPGLESQILFAEPIENSSFSESESESTSLTNHSSIESLPQVINYKSKQPETNDDISKCIDKLTDDINNLNQDENESKNNIKIPSSKKNILHSKSSKPKSIIRKHKQKKEKHLKSFILRPIENHPLLKIKSLSQKKINNFLKKYQQQTISSKDSNISNHNAPLDNINSQNSNKNFSMIIPNQDLVSLNGGNQQFKIGIPEAQNIAIELKPKWGFKPNPKTSQLSNPESFVKYDYCRFCLHYLFKNKEKIESHEIQDSNEVPPLLKNHFCPLDLYSGDDLRTRKAIDSLYNHPGNNLKLFINGKQINLKNLNKDKEKNKEGKDNSQKNKLYIDNDIKENKKAKEDEENSDQLIDNLADFFHCDKDMIKPVFCDFFTNLVLQESELFQRLKFHQRHLDSLDVEKIIKFYESFIEKGYKIDENSFNNKKEMKEPTIEDWIYGFEKYKEKIKSLPFAKEYTNFKSSKLDSSQSTINNNNDNNMNNDNDYSDEEKIQYILEFLISKTLKDCSILIAVQSVEENNKLEDGSISINTPLFMTHTSDSSMFTPEKSFINPSLNRRLNKKDSLILKQENDEIQTIINTTATEISIPIQELSSTSSVKEEESLSNLSFEKDKENYREIVINNKKYRYSIHVVDLDSKSIKKIPNYFKLDQDIVHCYTEYKRTYGDCRETKCID